MARDKGTGSVAWNEAKQRWVGTLEAGYTRRGTRRRVSVSAKGKRECLQKLKDKAAEIAKNGLSEEGRRTQNVKGYAEKWLSEREDQVRASSYNGDRWAINNYIIPTIGHRKVDKLNAGDVKAVVSACSNLAGTSAVRVHTTLITLLKAAIIDSYNVAPGALLVPAPPKNKSGREEIPLEHAVKILASLKGNPQRLRWYLALLQGMRPAEVLGLTEEAFDLEKHTVDISWQMKELPKATGGGYRKKKDEEYRQIVGAWHLARPKTDAGERVIPLIPWVETAYKEWLEIRPESPYGLVFPRASMDPRYVGHPIRDGWDRDAWACLIGGLEIPPKVSGEPYTLYECRHTTASLLRRLGVADHIVTMIMGHASIASTDAYTHITQAEARKALMSVGEALQLGA